MGFEPTTASLEGWNSTTELRPPDDLCLFRRDHNPLRTGCYTFRHAHQPHNLESGGQARIRTLEDISQQIYSLPPLATWVPARSDSPTCVLYEITPRIQQFFRLPAHRKN